MLRQFDIEEHAAHKVAAKDSVVTQAQSSSNILDIDPEANDCHTFFGNRKPFGSQKMHYTASALSFVTKALVAGNFGRTEIINALHHFDGKNSRGLDELKNTSERMSWHNVVDHAFNAYMKLSSAQKDAWKDIYKKSVPKSVNAKHDTKRVITEILTYFNHHLGQSRSKTPSDHHKNLDHMWPKGKPREKGGKGRSLKRGGKGGKKSNRRNDSQDSSVLHSSHAQLLHHRHVASSTPTNHVHGSMDPSDEHTRASVDLVRLLASNHFAYENKNLFQMHHINQDLFWVPLKQFDNINDGAARYAVALSMDMQIVNVALEIYMKQANKLQCAQTFTWAMKQIKGLKNVFAKLQSDTWLNDEKEIFFEKFPGFTTESIDFPHDLADADKEATEFFEHNHWASLQRMIYEFAHALKLYDSVTEILKATGGRGGLAKDMADKLAADNEFLEELKTRLTKEAQARSDLKTASKPGEVDMKVDYVQTKLKAFNDDEWKLGAGRALESNFLSRFVTLGNVALNILSTGCRAARTSQLLHDKIVNNYLGYRREVFHCGDQFLAIARFNKFVDKLKLLTTLDPAKYNPLKTLQETLDYNIAADGQQAITVADALCDHDYESVHSTQAKAKEFLRKAFVNQEAERIEFEAYTSSSHGEGAERDVLHLSAGSRAIAQTIAVKKFVDSVLALHPNHGFRNFKEIEFAAETIFGSTALHGYLRFINAGTDLANWQGTYDRGDIGGYGLTRWPIKYIYTGQKAYKQTVIENFTNIFNISKTITNAQEDYWRKVISWDYVRSQLTTSEIGRRIVHLKTALAEKEKNSHDNIEQIKKRAGHGSEILVRQPAPLITDPTKINLGLRPIPTLTPAQQEEAFRYYVEKMSQNPGGTNAAVASSSAQAGQAGQAGVSGVNALALAGAASSAGTGDRSDDVGDVSMADAKGNKRQFEGAGQGSGPGAGGGGGPGAGEGGGPVNLNARRVIPPTGGSEGIVE